jgi:salicylate hydroxylase
VSGIRIAVVGAGIGGLSVAAFLARAGIACAVYERAVALGEVGAGIQLSPNGSRLLHRAGLTTHLRAAAIRPAAIEVRRWRDNGTVARTELGAACEAEYGAPYYTLHRSVLYRGLLDLVTGTDPDAVRPGHRCVAVHEYPDRVDLRFADGSSAGADLVIGADGLHSVVRGALTGDGVRFAGLTVHRGLVRADRVPALTAESRVLIWLGPERHVVCYPVAAGWVNVVAASGCRTEAGPGPDPLGSAFAGWHRAVREVLTEVDAWTRWPLYDAAPLARWRTRRIALVGDAAHPLLPLGAQGANQAVEDAAALAACLRSGLADVPAALQRYERVRIPRLARVRAMVRDNTVNHHLPDGSRQRLRDGPMPARESLRARAWLYGYDAERVAR